MKSMMVFSKIFSKSILSNKLPYIIFVFAITITISSVIFFYSTQNESSRRQIEEGLDGRDTRSISFSVDSGVDKDFLINLLENEELQIENIQLLSNTLLNDEYEYSFFSEMNQTPYNSYFGERIDNNHIENSESVVIVPSEFLKENNLSFGDMIILDSKKFEIIGSNNLSDNEFEIPYTTMLANGYAQDVYVILPAYSTTAQYQLVENYINENAPFMVEMMNMPSGEDEISERSQIDMVSCIVIFVLAFVNFSYLYLFILEKRKQTFGIYRIVGCSVRKSFVFLITEIIILFSLCFILGVGLSYMMNYWLLPLIIDTAAVKLYLKDLLQIYFVSIVLMLIGTSVIVRRYLKIPPISHLKESEV